MKVLWFICHFFGFYTCISIILKPTLILIFNFSLSSIKWNINNNLLRKCSEFGPWHSYLVTALLKTLDTSLIFLDAQPITYCISRTKDVVNNICINCKKPIWVVSETHFFYCFEWTGSRNGFSETSHNLQIEDEANIAHFILRVFINTFEIKYAHTIFLNTYSGTYNKKNCI